jgi:hypothetical protein
MSATLITAAVKPPGGLAVRLLGLATENRQTSMFIIGTSSHRMKVRSAASKPLLSFNCILFLDLPASIVFFLFPDTSHETSGNDECRLSIDPPEAEWNRFAQPFIIDRSTQKLTTGRIHYFDIRHSLFDTYSPPEEDSLFAFS